MNKILGVVKSITSAGLLCKIELQSKIWGKNFSSLMVELDSFGGLKIGDELNMLFKENEVLIATPESVLSAANAFTCRVVEVEIGELLSQVWFDFEDQRVSSIITSTSLKRLQVEVGGEFMWFVKANEVTLQKVKDV